MLLSRQLLMHKQKPTLMLLQLKPQLSLKQQSIQSFQSSQPNLVIHQPPCSPSPVSCKWYAASHSSCPQSSTSSSARTLMMLKPEKAWSRVASSPPLDSSSSLLLPLSEPSSEPQASVLPSECSLTPSSSSTTSLSAKDMLDKLEQSIQINSKILEKYNKRRVFIFELDFIR